MMTREETMKAKQMALRLRADTLKKMKAPPQTGREAELLVEQLNLAHETIKVTSFNLDLMDVTEALA